jgi:hypothetical protein
VVISPSTHGSRVDEGAGVVDVVVVAVELCTDPGLAAHWEPGEYVKLTGGEDKWQLPPENEQAAQLPSRSHALMHSLKLGALTVR